MQFHIASPTLAVHRASETDRARGGIVWRACNQNPRWLASPLYSMCCTSRHLYTDGACFVNCTRSLTTHKNLGTPSPHAFVSEILRAKLYSLFSSPQGPWNSAYTTMKIIGMTLKTYVKAVERPNIFISTRKSQNVIFFFMPIWILYGENFWEKFCIKI